MLINVPLVIQQNHTIKKNPSIHTRFQVSHGKFSPLIYSNWTSLFTWFPLIHIPDGSNSTHSRTWPVSTVITLLKRHFASHGTLQVIITDNAYYITHQTNLTSFPTNGVLNTLPCHLAALKQTLLKKLWNVQSHCLLRCEKDDSDIYYGLLMLRNTPSAETS